MTLYVLLGLYCAALLGLTAVGSTGSDDGAGGKFGVGVGLPPGFCKDCRRFGWNSDLCRQLCRKTKEFNYTVDFSNGTTMMMTLEIKTRQPFIDYMQNAADLDSNFQFGGEYFSQLGWFIQKIGGVEAGAGQSFWALLKQENDSECLVPLGVSSFFPKKKNQIIFRFEEEAFLSHNDTVYCV